MVHASVGPLTKTTTQNIILGDDMVEYDQISHNIIESTASEEIKLYQNAGKI